MLAHDMRTPLNALILSIRSAKSSPSDANAVMQALDIAERNSVALLDIVETLVDTSENGGKGKLRMTEVLPLDLVTSAIDQIVPLAEAKGQRIDSQQMVALPTFVADGGRIIRVLVNLLSNAIRLSPEGGHIRVDAKPRKNDGHQAIVFSVADDGPGISSEEIDKIFEKGVSIEKGAKTSSGLGLTVCKEIVEAHGGRIWVETGRSKGATFSFSIPVGPQSSETD